MVFLTHAPVDVLYSHSLAHSLVPSHTLRTRAFHKHVSFAPIKIPAHSLSLAHFLAIFLATLTHIYLSLTITHALSPTHTHSLLFAFPTLMFSTDTLAVVPGPPRTRMLARPPCCGSPYTHALPISINPPEVTTSTITAATASSSSALSGPRYASSSLAFLLHFPPLQGVGVEAGRLQSVQNPLRVRILGRVVRANKLL
jgi:hypothetical protein